MIKLIRFNYWLEKGRRLYFTTPGFLRFLFRPAGFCLNGFRHLRIERWILTGEELSSKNSLAIRFAGSKINKNYIASLAYGDAPREEYHCVSWCWQRSWGKQTRTSDNDITITEMSRIFLWAFPKNKGFLIPCWVRGEMEIPQDIALFVKRSSSLTSNLNKIRRNRLDYRVTGGESQMREFYYHMYLPYITGVHKEKAVIDSYEELIGKFPKSKILIVTKDGQDIAGLVFQDMKQSIRLLILGVKDGNPDFVRDGASIALYYFTICYAQEAGYKWINLGGSRAFLNDGVLQHKKKWDMRISGISDVFFRMQIASVSDSVKSFLWNNPFVSKENGQLNSAIFWADKQPLNEKSMQDLCKRYRFPGISNLVLYTFTTGGYARWQDLSLNTTADKMPS